MVCQWAATPIERDRAENSALNLIPLASSRREMAGCQPRAKTNKEFFGGDYKITALCKTHVKYEIGKSGSDHSD